MGICKKYHNSWGASRSFFAVKNKKAGEPLVVLVQDVKSAEIVAKELSFFSGAIPVIEIPPIFQNPFEEMRPLADTLSKWSEALYNLIHYDDFILVVSPYSLLKKLPLKKDYLSSEFIIAKNSILSRDELLYALDILGYVQVEFVSGPGEFNIRGGLADIFPIDSNNPLSIEFFDDEPENIFYYNPENRSKIKNTDKVRILPCSDMLLSTDEFISRIKSPEIRDKAEAFGKFAGCYWYAPFADYNETSLFEYLPDNYSIISFSDHFYEDLKDAYGTIVETLENSRLDKRFLENFIDDEFAASRIKKSDLTIISEFADQTESVPLPFISIKNFFAYEKNNLYQSLTNAFGVINGFIKDKYKIAASIESDKFSGIFKDFARDYEIFSSEIEKYDECIPSSVSIYRGSVSGGFIDDKEKFVFITDSDIFGFTRRKPKPRKKDVFNTNISDLEEGDYVVHINHGIGIYKGIRHLTIGGVEGDYLYITYEGDDILYVPLHGISQIQKYIGAGDQKPKLNSLKSSAWSKLKKHAKESARHIAEDLLRLYAERKARKGFAFIDDGSMLNVFEQSFEYDETEDQLSAIIDVYNDMESETPMERLICGDVGFGKTEIAMRAVCKAVSCGKQAAVLVPTTVLARQHYETFQKRFSSLPVSIDYVSRFRSPKEIKDIFSRASDGRLDILIGTHKLLSKELLFKDLGLLVIDEEQRFGVSHKEKISAMKRSVDTLTLSATPIPRTLQLSLSGIRDMSIIETPPANRLSVAVKVVKEDEGIKKAIIKELERGGQVFFLHNKVSDIHEVALKVKETVPHARIEYAHGQMDAKSLENILQSFYSGDIDVLVSTTIIENGVDIPNVNTIIVNNAAHFGLSQLYQLKGRVGRSDRRAYCYLAVKNFSALTPIAKKRLSIIQQLSDLGSGFKIAMYDLQLRGAGNILGAEQSGFVVRVGYELYVSMIEEAVNEMKGDFTNLTDTEINSNIPYFIPADYIENPRVRFDYYRRFTSVSDSGMAEDLLSELEAGYGELREEIKNLAYIMLIKNAASKIGIQRIIITKSGAKLAFLPETKINPLAIGRAVISGKMIYRFIGEYELAISINCDKPLETLSLFFEKLYSLSL